MRRSANILFITFSTSTDTFFLLLTLIQRCCPNYILFTMDVLSLLAALLFCSIPTFWLRLSKTWLWKKNANSVFYSNTCYNGLLLTWYFRTLPSILIRVLSVFYPNARIVSIAAFGEEIQFWFDFRTRNQSQKSIFHQIYTQNRFWVSFFELMVNNFHISCWYWTHCSF